MPYHLATGQLIFANYYSIAQILTFLKIFYERSQIPEKMVSVYVAEGFKILSTL